MNNRNHMRQTIPLVMMVLLAGVLASCVSYREGAYQRGEEAINKNDYDAAVRHYLKALQSDPGDPRLRVSLADAMLAASNHHFQRGMESLDRGEADVALLEFDKALEFNPGNEPAGREKRALLKKIDEQNRASTGKPAAKTPAEETDDWFPGESIPITVSFKDLDVKEILRALQKFTKLNFIVDDGFQSKKITIETTNIRLKEILDLILLQTKTFYKIVGPQSILIIPDTAAKRRQYEDVVIKTFFLQEADCKQMQVFLKTVADVKVIAVNTELNAVTVRDTPQKMEMIEKLVRVHDKPRPEVLLNVEILEVNRNRAREYGINLGTSTVTQSLSPLQGGVSAGGTGSSSAASSTVRGNMLTHFNSSDFLFSLPSIAYMLLESDTKSRVLARPQLRALDQEVVSILLGDKVPTPQTSWVPYASGGLNQQPITSYNMIDVGIKIEMTPLVHLDGWITLKLKFELSFITSEGTTTIPPTIGNRTVTTVIRLKDNESTLLAGLLRDNERKSLSGLPFLSRIPVLKNIFGYNDRTVEQTDIVLAITPRIVHLPDIGAEDTAPIWAGSEEKLGLRNPPQELANPQTVVPSLSPDNAGEDEEEPSGAADGNNKAKDSDPISRR